jgi:hypothetical protein
MTKENFQDPRVHPCACPLCQRHPHSALAREHRRLNRLVAAADERTRRLLAGFRAGQHGRGGITLLARITGLDRHTIARGQHELRRGQRSLSRRLRRPGAGRPRAEKKAQRC